MSGREVTLPFDALAVLTIRPASRSGWVTTWVAVQVIESPGARLLVGGHVTATLLSVTVNGPVRVTLPVFVTLYVYVISSPTWSYDTGDADFTSVSSGVCSIGITRLSLTSAASFENAVTVFASTSVPAKGEPPASSSACENVCVAVQVIEAPGASSSAGSSLRPCCRRRARSQSP